MIAQYVSVNTLLQTIAKPDMTGRVISFYGMSFMTVTPLGAILIGTLADSFNIQDIFVTFSLLSLIAGLIYLTQKSRVQTELTRVLEAGTEAGNSDEHP
ncbi:hypothetical protein DSECCO2_449260 [anaerobic digester metagenome]